MRSSRLIATATWLVVTTMAVALAWIAVAHAVAGVADPVAIAAPSVTRPATPAANEVPTSTTVGDSEAGLAPTAVPERDQPTVGESSNAAPATEQPPDTDSSIAIPPSTSEPASQTKSFDSPGGVMTMGCDGDRASLVSATPHDGFTVTVLQTGPDDVDVEFRSGTKRYAIHGWCRDGVPSAEVGDD